MSMNTRDERLYHYEYRRPRVHNPTYNSINVFDSLNMFVRSDLPDPLLRSHPRYSLPHADIFPHRSALVDSRTLRPLNYSTIQPPSPAPRRDLLLNGKDYQYLQMIEERRRQGDLQSMGSSTLSQNAEHQPTPTNHQKEHFALRQPAHDALSTELQQFEAGRK